MKNGIVIPESVLKQIDSDWSKGSFIGYDLLKADQNVFLIENKDIIPKLKSDLFKALITSLITSERLVGKKQSISNCCHHVICEYNETGALKKGVIYLKPSSLYEERIRMLFSAGYFVLSNSEFIADNDIWALVEKLYSFSTSKQITLIARYFYETSGIFDIIKRNQSPLTICTVIIPGSHQSSFPYAVVDQAVGNRPYIVRYTKQKNKLHQREIIFKKIVVNFDINFSDAKKENKTWQMTAQMSDIVYNQKETLVHSFTVASRPRR